MGVRDQRLDWLVFVIVARGDASTAGEAVAFFGVFENEWAGQPRAPVRGTRGNGSDSGLFALLVVVKLLSHVCATARDTN